MKKFTLPSYEITPKSLYLSRREFLQAAGLLAGGLTLAACGLNSETPVSESPVDPATDAPIPPDDLVPNSFEEITNYNNYYEFTYDKAGVAEAAKNFPTSPWEVEVLGAVRNPTKMDVEQLIRTYQPEERIYRMRCVEGWSMVIPWMGFPLAKLLAAAEPTAEAKYVRFISVFKPDEMPGQNDSSYPWPYQEGLRLDEALNDLTILATGLYGGELPVQNGGGIRLVVPWKYGFKSIKAVVRIELTAEQPATLWNAIAPREYGFYSNVNPEVDHPRWSQRTERRIGEPGRRDTLMFNGYAEEVASLYTGMDLRQNY